MKLKFKNQNFQTDMINAIVDLLKVIPQCQLLIIFLKIRVLN